MSKIIGALLLVALAVRLVVLFFFKRNIVLNEISLVLFIAVFVVAVIVMLVKWWKKNYKLPPVKAIMYGGPQEHGIRPGTVPVALVAGCGKACEIAELEYIHRAEKLKFVKDLVLQMLGESGLDFTINGDQNYCMNNTLNVCLHGVSSEALMILTKQYCGISNGSACTSKSYSPSYVLLAMGVPVEQIENSVRISWGADTDPDLLKAEFSKMLSMAKKLAQ